MFFEKDKSAFVFIEFQQEWIGPDARLKNLLVKNKNKFEQVVKAAALIIETARQKKYNIVHAGLDLSHDANYLIFGQGRNKSGLASAIPRAKTWDEKGAQFVEPFVPRNGEFVVKGRSGASVLKNSTLDPYLRNNDITTLFLSGFAIHVCIESTLREAHDMGLNTIVILDACGAFEDEQSTYFENHILHHFGQGIKSQELLNVI